VFVETYRKRQQLYQEEFVILEKMRTSFDRFYPYAAHLNTLIQDKIFLSANFSDLYDSIRAYYEKANDSIQELKKIIDDYGDLLEKENKEFLRVKKEEEAKATKKMLEKKARKLKALKDIQKKFKSGKTKGKSSNIPKAAVPVTVQEDRTISKANGNKESKLMISQVLKKDEIFAFQNQFVSTQIYTKSFLNFVMKKIKDTDEKNERLKFRLADQMNKLRVRIGFINSQKQKLFEYMLE
jgi:hypothetical protein